MPTLVYTPGVKMHIETTTSGIIDVSDDLVSGTIMLRENAPHTVQFELQNAQRKYDGSLLPMDKISIQLKRLNWLQVFTGYLNDPPIFQAFPGTLTMSATCTLKIPQFFATDTTTTAFTTMVLKALGQSASTDNKGTKGDVGLSRLINDSMSQVLKWPKDRIHIGAVPNNWFKFAEPVLKAVQADEALYAVIGPSYTAAGSYNGITTTLQPGDYGRFVYGECNLDTTQASNISVVISTALSLYPDMTYMAVMAVMAVLTESVGYNYANTNVPTSLDIPHDKVGHDHASVGILQQQTGTKYSSASTMGSAAGWGTPQELMDIPTATKKFLTDLVTKIPRSNAGISSFPETMYGDYIQAVQGSAPGTYQANLSAAKKMVAQAKKVAKKTTGTSVQIGGGVVTDPSTGYKATGSQFAKVAMNLIALHKTSPIRYDQSRSDPKLYQTPLDQVTYLDCSSLVDVVYYNTTGKGLPDPNGNVAAIRPTCKIISVDAASHIQGAVLMNGIEHIGVSLGNGVSHVAAHMAYSDVSKDVNISPIEGNGFTDGGLLPGIDYSSSATTQAGMDALKAAGVKVKGKAPQLTDVNDPTILGSTQDGTADSPFQSLLNNIFLNPDAVDTSGDAIGGAAALINDQYFLPWLQAVVNSSMRSFCSAPNGDFIAWFPDYFGAWGTAGIVNIERIELQNFQVNWSDQQMVTHQFVLGNLGATLLDPTTGTVSSNSPVTDLISLAKSSAGIASLDFPEIFNVIYGETAPSGFTKSFLQRFGARPDVQQMANVPNGAAVFFMALYLFMQHWAAQFSASVPMTFMPELFPGMLLRVPEYGFQAYVQGVTHTFQFGQGGGFQTQADICSPSNIGKSDRTDLLSLLPLGGAKAS